MILKGNQRTGAADLATHLSNEYDNERIEIAQLRGVAANDLHGALGEFAALAQATRCRQPLYSLSISPASPLSREQYYSAIDHIPAARLPCLCRRSATAWSGWQQYGRHDDRADAV